MMWTQEGVLTSYRGNASFVPLERDDQDLDSANPDITRLLIRRSLSHNSKQRRGVEHVLPQKYCCQALKVVLCTARKAGRSTNEKCRLVTPEEYDHRHYSTNHLCKWVLRNCFVYVNCTSARVRSRDQRAACLVCRPLDILRVTRRKSNPAFW